MIKTRWIEALAVAVALAFPPHGTALATTIAPDLTRITDAKAWTVHHATAEVVNVDGKQAVKLVAEGDSANGIVGLALVNRPEFVTGTIEIDLKGKDIKQGSFLGVAFNVGGAKTFEGVYFRPFNFKADGPARGHAVQYIAWPVNTWERLRRNQPGQFEAPVKPAPDAASWFHARIEVDRKQVRVFVNDATAPCLTVDRLAHGETGRPMGLFVDSAEGLYADLKVTPTG